MEVGNRLAVVTGGTSGIGLETARQLVTAGFRVELWARDERKAAAAAKELDAGGGRVSFRVCDVAAEAQVAAAARELAGSGGRVDALINCAGVLRRNPLGGAPAELARVREQLDINLWGTIHVTTHLTELLAAGSRPIVVNLGSVAGRQPFAGLSAYGASKAAVAFFTRAAAQELFGRGIRVVCVCPGVVDTPLLPVAERALLKKSLPGRRLQQPAEIARLITSLVTGDLPSLTGAVIDFDDGAAFPAEVGAPAAAPAPVPAAAPAAAAAPAHDPIADKLRGLFVEVFGTPRDKVNDATGPDDIVKWDSLGHTRLVTAIEKAFGCSLTVDEVMELTSFGAIRRTLHRKSA